MVVVLLTRYSYAVRIYGTVVVCLYLMDVLWLSVGS